MIPCVSSTSTACLQGMVRYAAAMGEGRGGGEGWKGEIPEEKIMTVRFSALQCTK